MKKFHFEILATSILALLGSVALADQFVSISATAQGVAPHGDVASARQNARIHARQKVTDQCHHMGGVIFDLQPQPGPCHKVPGTFNQVACTVTMHAQCRVPGPGPHHPH